MSKGIDISRKCDKTCLENKNVTVESGLVNGLSDYGYITHQSDNGVPITQLGYGAKRIQNIENRSIQEVTVYYYEKYETNPDIINRPLFLRVYYGGMRYLYKSIITGSSIEWNDITSNFGGIPTENKTTPNFTEKIKVQTCELYSPHSVDIYEDRSYSCPCESINLNVEKSLNKDGIKGYISYLHRYEDTITRVRYKGAILKWKGEGVEDEEIPLSEVIKNLTVYYWDQDKDHRKGPLLMEVYVGVIPVLVGNNGESDNGNWTMIGIEPVSKDNLHKQKCKLFRPVDINVSAKSHYNNDYCKNDMGNECTNEVTVENHDGPTPKGYAALKHTYGNGEEGDKKTFTVTGFKNGSFLQELIPPLWNVTKVVVFLTSCAGPSDPASNTPLLVYVKKSDEGTKETHNWYSRTSRDGSKWTEEGDLEGNDPQTAYKNGYLVTTLNRIKSELSIECQEDIQRELKKKKLEEAEAQIQLSQSASISGSSAKDGELCKAIGTILGLGSIAAAEVGLGVTKELLEWADELGLDASALALNLVGEALGLANIVLASGDKEESEKEAKPHASVLVEGARSSVEVSRAGAPQPDNQVNNDHDKASGIPSGPTPILAGPTTLGAIEVQDAGSGVQEKGAPGTERETGSRGSVGQAGSEGGSRDSEADTGGRIASPPGINSYQGGKGDGTEKGSGEGGADGDEQPTDSAHLRTQDVNQESIVDSNQSNVSSDQTDTTSIVTPSGTVPQTTASEEESRTDHPTFKGSPVPGAKAATPRTATTTVANDGSHPDTSETTQPSGVPEGQGLPATSSEGKHTTDAPGSTLPSDSEDPTTPARSTGGLLEVPVVASIAGYFFAGSAGAGGLTGLGWWAFKRSRGDPWVIHGYPRVFKECTILSMHRLFIVITIHPYCPFCSDQLRH
ncbi:hypothetical protein BEWA_029660 [Theileria equi strain WA]|uniref:Uncharacterized protein n=1 Tax=Theileria equi strain WA TaxID=1537102 RepID=L0AX28_THEEQ|nr:hypothetical protein BEWA_029660 [Theileria equi strain WA]AFZ80115.1 hypothetical protein BEWA_029660 [Theileria equi strain WA]|eukprot:XP_004829781.1 hypothetical protein BEWA_029660 [Theileria equi strain WA]